MTEIQETCIPHSNVGIEHERTKFKSGNLEKAFADTWQDKNEEVPGLNNGLGTLQNLYITTDNQDYHKTLTLEERTAAATAIQWLGTNVGFGFLQEALRKCGYVIIEDKWRDKMWGWKQKLDILFSTNLPKFKNE